MPDSAPASGFVDRLKRRKLVQWGLAYLAGAWVAVQVAGELADRWGWPDPILRGFHLVLLVGFVAVLVLAWYHGKQGRQRVSGVELVMLAALLGAAGVGLAVLRAEGGSGEAVSDAGHGVAPLAETPPPRSVAVLPLANRSPDPDDAYLAGAITDQLTTSLGRAGLHVPSSTSAARFADTALAADRIASALGVGHLLEGSVQRSGDRLLVNLRLVDPEKDQLIWQEDYNRPFEAVLNLQSEIAGEVAKALQSTFSEEDMARTFAGTENPRAWDLVQRALESPGPGSADLLREAIRLDSTFAFAWAVLATYHADRAGPGWRDSTRISLETALRHVEDPTLRLALRAYLAQTLGETGFTDEWVAEARRAVQEFPSDAPLVSLLASALLKRGELVEAVRWARRYVTLDPMRAYTWRRLGELYVLLEMREAGEAALEHALELSQRDGSLELARLYAKEGRYDEALEQSSAVDEADRGELTRGMVLLWAGEVREARDVLEGQFAQLDFGDAYSWTPELVYARRATGAPASSDVMLERAEHLALERTALDPNVYGSLMQLAVLQDDVSLATDRLKEGIDAGFRDAWSLRSDPILAPARADSAFAATLARLERRIVRAREAVERMPDETTRL